MLRRSANPSRSFLMILRSRHSPRIARIEAKPAKVEVSAQIEFNPTLHWRVCCQHDPLGKLSSSSRFR